MTPTIYEIDESFVPRGNFIVQCGKYSVSFNSGGNSAGNPHAYDTIAVFDAVSEKARIESFTRPATWASGPKNYPTSNQ